MATLEENYKFWNDDYNWTSYRGNQWSSHWGSPENQWNWCIYPRIQEHLPTDTILEIGSGHGRWTSFLKSQCRHLILVDISDKCIEVCRQRFGPDGMSYHVSDGRSLSFLDSDSVDFAFSFESLIHTEILDLKGYLKDLKRVLKDDGSAFIHHSNLGSYRNHFERSDKLPKPVAQFLRERGILDFDEWRARSVTHSNFQSAAQEFDLAVTSQELVPWGGKLLIDCFSTLRMSPENRENRVIENPQFVKRAKEIRSFSRLYGNRQSWLSSGPRDG